MRQESLDILKKYGAVKVTDGQNDPQNNKISDRSRQILEKYGAQPVQDPQEFSWKDRALKAVEGPLEVYGSIEPALAKEQYGEGPRTFMSDIATNYQNLEQLPEGYKSFTETAKAGLNEMADQDLSQQNDKTAKVLKTATEILTPLSIPGLGTAASIAGKGAKAIGKELLKGAAKESSTALGASAALNLTPNFTEESGAGRVIEDLAKMIIGVKAGEKLGSPEALRAAKRIINLKDMSEKTAAKLLSAGSKPNKEVLELAKQKGIELPFNVGANNKGHNFLANNYLKSWFVSDAYKQVLKNADEQMVNAVKKSIDTLGDSELLPNAASTEYRNFLKQDELKFKAEAKTLYDEARDTLKTTANIEPKNTVESLYSDAVKDLLNKISPSDAEKKVINRIKEISGKLVGESELPTSVAADETKIKGAAEAYKKATKQESKTSVKDLIDLRSSLMNTLDYDTEVKGVEAYLSRLVGDLTKDIEGYGNKEFISKWQKANQFFKQNIANRFRTDIARSLMTGEVPLEAISKMNSVGNIQQLRKIAGESDKGQEIFKALSKAKLREIFSNSFTDGSLQAGNFYKIFDKKEKVSELVKELIGKTEYKNLEEIGKIAGEFSKAGKELLNTSGTAIATSDITKAELLVKTTIGSLLGGSVGYATGGLSHAVLGVAMPNILSRIVANPKVVNQAHAYALARQAGKEKEAQTILKRLVKMVDADIATKSGKYFAAEENE